MAQRIRDRAQMRVVLVAVITGVVTGLAGTYPWELGAAASLLFWALVGLLLGVLVGRDRHVLAAGAIFGVFLTLAFLYSRFGGAAHDLPAYTAFVLAMSIAGGLAGVITVYAGSRIRART